MNLIKDPWIPVRREDGTSPLIAPWEIGRGDNPVVSIDAPRPDFRSALYQFLIGLVQTTYAPEDHDDWKELWNEPPSCEELKTAFARFSKAFELYNPEGPAFMQDYDLPEDAGELNIRALLIDAPGENALKKNLDHFVKRNFVERMCNFCTATALFCLQTNAPAGGQGIRTGLRGGGPLTTLVIPDRENSTPWEIVWLNVLTLQDRFKTLPKKPVAAVFPWMGPIRESIKGEETHSNQVDELQLYWGMPRRIRLQETNEKGKCDICGRESQVWKSYRAKNFGINYSSTWKHALSPYRKKDKDGTTLLLSVKGKQGGYSYPDWLALTLITNETSSEPADVVKYFFDTKIHILPSRRGRIWCAGYDMDNMKARCWYDQILPIFFLPPEKRRVFIYEVNKMIRAASDVAYFLHSHVKEAWFSRPKDVKGDTSYIKTVFFDDTESEFFSVTESVLHALEVEEETASLLEKWRQIIINMAECLFDRFALQDTDEPKSMKRIAAASRSLSLKLHSFKTKSLQELREVQ